MTANRRIFLNVVATYGRSVYSLLCGVFTARWVLMALGQTDYGLFGLIGGLAVFITFINGLLASALSRFYAVSVGEAILSDSPEEGVVICRRWFSIGVLIHTAVPIALIIIGYPIGVWAIKSFLVIPECRLVDCVWLFRFVCFRCCVAMMNVPYTAMYNAKQYIAELTLYSFVTTTLNVVFLYYMVTHPGAWLLRYGIWTCAIGVVPEVIIMMRARIVFSECRFRFAYCLDWHRIMQLLSYAWWRTFGCMGLTLRQHGVSILVNKYFGPKINASMAVATSLSGHANSLSMALIGAFSPAISTAYGAGDMVLVRNLSFRSCKFSMVTTLLFMIPLILELDEVIQLWLKNPPPYVVGLAICMLMSDFAEKSTIGHAVAVNVCGKIAGYQTLLGAVNILSLPLSWCFLACGCNVYFVGLSMFITMVCFAWGRLWFGWTLLGLSAWHWLSRIMMPMVIAGLSSAAFASIPIFFIEKCFVRILLTGTAFEIVFLPLVWCLVLDVSERDYVKERLKMIFQKR